MSSPSSKRRRITTNAEQSGEEVVPPEVVSSIGPPAAVVPGGDAAAGNTGEVTVTVDLVQPQLEEIPKLIVVDMQKDNADDVAGAIKKLYDLLGTDDPDSKKNQKLAIGLGAATVVIGALRRWQMNEGVQKEGCGCLIRLAYNHCDGTSWIVQSGGVEALINAMKQFPDTSSVNSNASGGLRNLFNDTSVRESSGRRFVEDLKGLELLLEAMKTFPNDAQLQEDCCVIFGAFATEKEMRDTMVRAGVLTAVSGAIERHFENENVRAQGEDFMQIMYSKK